MSLSFYDAVVPSSLQILRATDALLDKAAAFATERGVTEAAIIEARLAHDMLPFGYQILACADHSAGAIAGVVAGMFAPEITTWPATIEGLHAVILGAIDQLEALDPSEFETLADAQTVFVAGDLRLPFSGSDFLLSFSQPNFYFHAATAYGIFRKQGGVIGKMDFMGTLRTSL